MNEQENNSAVGTRRKGEGGRAICAKDIYEVPRLALQCALAWIVPEAAWWPLSRLFGQVNAMVHPVRTRDEAKRVEAVIENSEIAGKGYQIATAIWSNRYEERFHYLRAWRLDGWSPSIEICGAEHVEAARAEGRGIVFWGSNFSFNDLVTKMALHRLGLSVLHFSRPEHGFSATRFGIRYLNSVRRRIEDEYLGQRLMTPVSGTQQALESIRAELAAGGAVSFTVGNRGRYQESARFLGGELRLATGPLATAHSVGAIVLPVFTLRVAPGHFHVTIGGQLDLGNSHRRPDYAAMVQCYADMLSPFVLRDPRQWKGWRYMVPKQALPFEVKEQ